MGHGARYSWAWNEAFLAGLLEGGARPSSRQALAEPHLRGVVAAMAARGYAGCTPALTKKYQNALQYTLLRVERKKKEKITKTPLNTLYSTKTPLNTLYSTKTP